MKFLLGPMVDDVCTTLEKILTHLENTEEYKTSHGVHFDAVEARKLLDRLKEEG